ncbi:MAG: TVP38/TMEM64 family protein [Actinomycetota bacterium]|nr:TVP38/TMEM64 family protein [Actinomycetota bacterium]
MEPIQREIQEQQGVPVRPHARTLALRAIVGVVLVVALFLLLWLTGWEESLWGLFSDRERLQRVVDDAGLLAPVVYLVFLVIQAVLAPLPAPALAMGGGYSFGIYQGFLLTWLGALLGGVISFWISRWLGRDFVAGTERMQRLDRYVDQHGTITIFVLRLLPLVSFDVISYAAGLSSIPFWKFFLASALGMVPGTLAFVYLGGASSSTGFALALIGLSVLAIVAYLYQRRRLKLRRRVR